MNRTPAFTLTEVLVALGILGVLAAALVTWQTSTTRVTTQAAAHSALFANLSDATGYLSDRIGTAIHVYDSVSVNGTNCTPLAPDPAERCLALIVPEARGGPGIDTLLLVAYRLRGRQDSCCRNDVQPDAWADANTRVLVEYRKIVCGPSPACANAPFPQSVSGADPSVILDRIVLGSTDSYLTLLEVSSADACSTSTCARKARQVKIALSSELRLNGARWNAPATAHENLLVHLQNIPEAR